LNRMRPTGKIHKGSHRDPHRYDQFGLGIKVGKTGYPTLWLPTVVPEPFGFAQGGVNLKGPYQVLTFLSGPSLRLKVK